MPSFRMPSHVSPHPRRTRTGTLAGLAAVLALGVLVSCAQDAVDRSGRATQIFEECLERHGVVASGVAVTVSDDAIVESVAATILEEADVEYEPAVRLACTEEVESRLTGD